MNSASILEHLECPLHPKQDLECEFCNGTKSFYQNHLGVTHPLLALYWDQKSNHPLTIYEVTQASNQLIHWQCPTCHQKWVASVCQMATDFPKNHIH